MPAAESQVVATPVDDRAQDTTLNLPSRANERVGRAFRKCVDGAMSGQVIIADG